MVIFQYRSTGDPQFVRVILAPEPCNFHCIVVKKLQERLAPFVQLCRIEKKKKKKKTCQIFQPMRVILAQGSCQVLQILDV